MIQHLTAPLRYSLCVSKILEGLAPEQLLSHCLSVDAIPDEQYCFLPKPFDCVATLGSFRGLGACIGHKEVHPQLLH